MFGEESRKMETGNGSLDWAMASEFVTEEEEMEGEQTSEGKLHCSFNMEKIAEAFSCMTQEKVEIFQKINFAGLLKLPKKILYLDSLEFGEFRTKQYILPRVVDFSYNVLRTRIEMDTHRNTSEGIKYGKCELRHPFETIYTYGEKYRALEEKMENASRQETDHDEVVMLGEFFNFYIHNEKKNLRKHAAESVDKACSSMDRCLQNLIETAGVWFQKRKEEGGHDTGSGRIHDKKDNGQNPLNVSSTNDETQAGDDLCTNLHGAIANEAIGKGRIKRMAIKSVRGSRHLKRRNGNGEPEGSDKNGQPRQTGVESLSSV